MTEDRPESYPDVRLRYKKGDLMIKEGDFGISIYKIISGKVLVYAEAEDLEIPLAVLGAGEVIGEMIFLDRKIERRSASARALENTEVESWNPGMLAEEYEGMPPILRIIADQALARLIRMNRLIPQLVKRGSEEEEKSKLRPAHLEQRRHYRKEVSLQASCRPVGDTIGRVMSGEIKDISMGGMGMEIRPPSQARFPCKEGDVFMINTILPNGKDIEFRARILSVKKGSAPGKLFWGMSFTDLTDIATREIGFFLMPA